MTRYVIADVLLFDDEVYVISTLGCPDNSVMLGAAASRCFSTLLEAQGAIVTKKELLHAGWERYGQQVSANSVNQSIAQIRRCLSSLGNPDYVVTVPRIGYKVCDGLSIIKLGCGAAVYDIKEADVEEPEPDLSVDLIVDTPQGGSHKHTKAYPYLYLGRVVVVLVNMCLALGGYTLQKSSPLLTAVDFSYLPIPNKENRRLFAAPSVYMNPERVERHIRTLKKHPPTFISGGLYEYVYFNGALRDEAYSYFLCHGPIEVSQTGCFSYFVVDEYKP